jgi:hypothetical protein
MIFKSIMARFLKILLIVGASVLAGAQTQTAERESPPQHGSETYWLVVDKFANGAVRLADAKRFIQLHEGSLTDRQCQQYSRIAVDYAHQLAAVRQAGVSAQSKFWNDVRAYSVSMIGAPGVPIPGRRTSKYWVTTGSAAEDLELRRIVSFEIDEASAQLSTSRANFCPDFKPAFNSPRENAMTTHSNSRHAASHHHRYARLYRAVILRAVQDLAQKEHRNEAREWLLSPESDYAFSTAGISPHSIRQQMI